MMSNYVIHVYDQNFSFVEKIDIICTYQSLISECMRMSLQRGKGSKEKYLSYFIPVTRIGSKNIANYEVTPFLVHQGCRHLIPDDLATLSDIIKWKKEPVCCQ